jgi:hypothetical protein
MLQLLRTTLVMIGCEMNYPSCVCNNATSQIAAGWDEIVGHREAGAVTAMCRVWGALLSSHYRWFRIAGYEKKRWGHNLRVLYAVTNISEIQTSARATLPLEDEIGSQVMSGVGKFRKRTHSAMTLVKYQSCLFLYMYIYRSKVGYSYTS